jgi:hypothetical protein
LKAIFEGRVYGMARYAQDDSILTMALAGYEAEKTKIEAAIAEIRTELGRRGSARGAVTSETGVTRKRTLSAAARRRIALAQKKRWAAIKNAKSAPPKPKRTLSAAGRKAIVEALRKRWAAVREAKARKSAPRPKGRKAVVKAPKPPVQSATTTA